ncbi:hypothetical protein DERF_004821 [Dermatophagoides farinae]|uniref:Uncharacterized protein n=1 Tax=Dermatophagoides farinae TaxID=6954 RepID=A0A922I2R6_DERFA|nr:hypothetical protein DERF_004821 [Dermatophagoides farinae]
MPLLAIILMLTTTATTVIGTCAFIKRKKTAIKTAANDSEQPAEDEDVETGDDEQAIGDAGPTNGDNEAVVEQKVQGEKVGVIKEEKIKEIIKNIVQQQLVPIKLEKVKVEKIDSTPIAIDENITLRISETMSEKEQERRPPDKSQQKSSFNSQASIKLSTKRMLRSSGSKILNKRSVTAKKDFMKLFVALKQPHKKYSSSASMTIRGGQAQKIPKIFVFKKNMSKANTLMINKKQMMKKEIKGDDFSTEQLLIEPKTIKTKDSEEMISIKAKAIVPVSWITDSAASKEQQRFDMKHILERLLRKINLWPKTITKTTQQRSPTTGIIRSVTKPPITKMAQSRIKTSGSLPNKSVQQPRWQTTSTRYDNEDDYQLKRRKSFSKPTSISHHWELQKQQQQQPRSIQRSVKLIGYDNDQRYKTSPPPSPTTFRSKPMMKKQSPQETIRVSEALLVPQRLKLKLIRQNVRKSPEIFNHIIRPSSPKTSTPKWWNDRMIIIKKSPRWTPPPLWLKKSESKSPKIKIPTRYVSPR